MYGLHNKLTNWRIEHDYTQSEFASMMNVSTRLIQYWEKGDRYPSIDSLIILANIMNVSLDYLCGRTTIWQTSERILKEQNII